MKTRASGFTLIELLVVVGILAVLAAILFPVITAVKEKAGQTTCLSNMKQLGDGIRLYQDEWNGRYPGVRAATELPWDPAGNWAGVHVVSGKCEPRLGQIYTYIKNTNVYSCPSDRRIKPGLVQAPALPYPLSYSMNYMLSNRPSGNVTNSATKVGLLIHEDRATINDGEFYWTKGNGWYDDAYNEKVLLSEPSRIHSGGTCVLYCDLHVKWQRFGSVIRALDTAEWNPRG